MHHIKVPPEWAQEFADADIRILDTHYFREAGEAWSTTVYRAEPKADEKKTVEFTVMKTPCPEARRAIHLGKRLAMLDEARLAPLAHVVPLLSSKVFEETTFAMRPAADSTLERRVLADGGAAAAPKKSFAPWSKPPQQTKQHMAVNESLPLLLDVLHGLGGLELAGVVPLDLTADTVALRGGRAFLTGLGKACLAHDGDAGFGCGSFWDRDDFLLGSALRHAPEMAGGSVTGASNSVWAAGLLFAEVALGGLPTRDFLMKEGPGGRLDRATFSHNSQNHKEALKKLDSEPQGRDTIREAILLDFKIENAEGFQEAPGDIQELLLGMLAKEAPRRWTAREALDQARRVASRRGLQVPMEARLAELPVAFVEAER